MFSDITQASFLTDQLIRLVRGPGKALASFPGVHFDPFLPQSLATQTWPSGQRWNWAQRGSGPDRLWSLGECIFRRRKKGSLQTDQCLLSWGHSGRTASRGLEGSPHSAACLWRSGDKTGDSVYAMCPGRPTKQIQHISLLETEAESSIPWPYSNCAGAQVKCVSELLR